jgi:hypothetical protein
MASNAGKINTPSLAMAMLRWPFAVLEYASKVRLGGSATQAARTSDSGRIVTQGEGQVNVTAAIGRFGRGGWEGGTFGGLRPIPFLANIRHA